MRPPKILFLSNGHGEDTVGAEIAGRLQDHRPDYDLIAMPIVGRGDPYRSKGIPIVGRTEAMPSGGFIYTSRRAAIRDVKHGVLGLIVDQVRTLRSLAADVDWVVGIGDKVILYLVSWFLKRPLVFVGVAYSAYYTDARPVYGAGLRRILSKWSPLVYARDEVTAEQLRQLGVSQAVFVGNPMMDCFETTGDDLGIPSGHELVGILPGSRSEAYGNLKLILQGVDQLQLLSGGRRRPLGYVVALAGNLDLDTVFSTLAEDGWVPRMPGEHRVPPGVVGTVVSPSGATVVLTRGRFGDVISHSAIIIGLAGTANEQAAGLGKPIVTFPGTGDQTTLRFVESQGRLLGAAVHVTKRHSETIAREVLSILDDPARQEYMAEVGRHRMGAAGAVDCMIADVCKLVDGAMGQNAP